MNCPNCHGSQVVCLDSRGYASTVKRRRRCLDCGHRFSTVELEIGVLRIAYAAIQAILSAAEFNPEK